jgi:hypothetical protein
MVLLVLLVSRVPEVTQVVREKEETSDKCMFFTFKIRLCLNFIF